MQSFFYVILWKYNREAKIIMQTIEVNTNAEKKAFLDVARKIYKNDPNWICPLDSDIESVFDPLKNANHQNGKSIRWILKNSHGKVTGRIAAFIDEKKASLSGMPVGGCGFFECIDNQDAADLLFDTARIWLAKNGMKAMNGPINFGENDMWWGLLVEGFAPPYYGMNYHQPYYKRLFERYGFEPQYEQISNSIDISKPFPERFTKIAEWVIKKPGYRFEHLKKKEFERFADDFKEIYNDAWKDFKNFIPITDSAIRQTMEKMRVIMDEKLIWFAYVNDEPASMILIIPDINELIYNLNGKLGIYGKMKFLYNKRVHKNKRMRAVVMGTKTKFQKHGLESAMFIKLKEYVLPLNQYKELELSWVGDFNTKMLALHDATGATFSRKHITYRYAFKSQNAE
ncbi:MAG: GNAT family N-acetyltransferase [Chitinophagaceae bacterium]|nr:GNAT family N-acetyltransferase [Chitinophagaceae bacterium]